MAAAGSLTMDSPHEINSIALSYQVNNNAAARAARCYRRAALSSLRPHQRACDSRSSFSEPVSSRAA